MSNIIFEINAESENRLVRIEEKIKTTKKGPKYEFEQFKIIKSKIEITKTTKADLLDMLRAEKVDDQIIKVLELAKCGISKHNRTAVFKVRKGGNFKFFNYKLVKNNDAFDFIGEFHSSKFKLTGLIRKIFSMVKEHTVVFNFNKKSTQVRNIPKKLTPEQIDELYDFFFNCFKLTGFATN